MEPQRDPSTFTGGLAKDGGAAGLSSAVVVLITMAKPDLTLEQGLALVTVGAALVGLARRAFEEWRASRGPGSGKGAGLVSIALLAAIVSVGCASSKSIPTSSDASVSADVVTAKGGTIACASGLTASLDPATGNVTQLSCASNAAWTDPPTTEETTALSKFGESLIGLVSLPITMLRAALGAAP